MLVLASSPQHHLSKRAGEVFGRRVGDERGDGDLGAVSLVDLVEQPGRAEGVSAESKKSSPSVGGLPAASIHHSTTCSGNPVDAVADDTPTGSRRVSAGRSGLPESVSGSCGHRRIRAGTACAGSSFARCCRS
jgi:hypothetical protein